VLPQALVPVAAGGDAAVGGEAAAVAVHARYRTTQAAAAVAAPLLCVLAAVPAAAVAVGLLSALAGLVSILALAWTPAPVLAAQSAAPDRATAAAETRWRPVVLASATLQCAGLLPFLPPCSPLTSACACAQWHRSPC
jgi:hypothetical protein